MDDILQHYETELDYMRRAFREFEAAHPQKSNALKIKAGHSEDPDIQRLADSLALVSARLSKRLDDTLPEFALDLAGMIAPSFLIGAPAYCPVQMDPASTELAQVTTLKSGALMEIAAQDGRPACRYSVARDTQLSPMTVTAVRLERAPFFFDLPDQLRNCEAAICVTLSGSDPNLSLTDVLEDTLELYVSASGGRKRRLIDTLSGDLLGLGCASAENPHTRMIPQDSFSLQFISDPGCFLPVTPTEMPELTRLHDFFCYPDKASWFTLTGVRGLCTDLPPGPVELRFFLNNSGAQKLNTLENGDLATNVVPALNCYREQSRPMRYDYSRAQVPVTPQSASEMPSETLQIEALHMLTPEGEIHLPEITTPGGRFSRDLPIWQERYLTGNTDPSRREVSFSVTGDAPAFDFIAKLICSNGNAAFALRQGQQVFFNDKQLAEVPFVVLEEPSVPVPPDTSAGRLWDVLSLINGNFSSVFDAHDPTIVLKEALSLCAPAGIGGAANAIWNVTVEQSVAPVKIGRHMLLSSGSQIEVTLDFDALPFPPFVFGAALQLFFNALISYDRFIQLRIRERGRDAPFAIFPTIHGGQISG